MGWECRSSGGSCPDLIAVVPSLRFIFDLGDPTDPKLWASLEVAVQKEVTESQVGAMTGARQGLPHSPQQLPHIASHSTWQLPSLRISSAPFMPRPFPRFHSHQHRTRIQTAPASRKTWSPQITRPRKHSSSALSKSPVLQRAADHPVPAPTLLPAASGSLRQKSLIHPLRQPTSFVLLRILGGRTLAPHFSPILHPSGHFPGTFSTKENDAARTLGRQAAFCPTLAASSDPAR